MIMGDYVGPWQKEGGRENAYRRTSDGRCAAQVSPPGGADNGRWGWFAKLRSGVSKGGKVYGDEMTARRVADEALAELRAEHQAVPSKYVVAWHRAGVAPGFRQGVDNSDAFYQGFVVMTRRGRRRAARLLGSPGRRRARPYPVAYANSERGMRSG